MKQAKISQFFFAKNDFNCTPPLKANDSSLRSVTTIAKMKRLSPTTPTITCKDPIVNDDDDEFETVGSSVLLKANDLYLNSNVMNSSLATNIKYSSDETDCIIVTSTSTVKTLNERLHTVNTKQNDYTNSNRETIISSSKLENGSLKPKVNAEFQLNSISTSRNRENAKAKPALNNKIDHNPKNRKLQDKSNDVKNTAKKNRTVLVHEEKEIKSAPTSLRIHTRKHVSHEKIIPKTVKRNVVKEEIGSPFTVSLSDQSSIDFSMDRSDNLLSSSPFTAHTSSIPFQDVQHSPIYTCPTEKRCNSPEKKSNELVSKPMLSRSVNAIPDRLKRDMDDRSTPSTEDELLVSKKLKPSPMKSQSSSTIPSSIDDLLSANVTASYIKENQIVGERMKSDNSSIVTKPVFDESKSTNTKKEPIVKKKIDEPIWSNDDFLSNLERIKKESVFDYSSDDDFLNDFKKTRNVPTRISSSTPKITKPSTENDLMDLEKLLSTASKMKNRILKYEAFSNQLENEKSSLEIPSQISTNVLEQVGIDNRLLNEVANEELVTVVHILQTPNLLYQNDLNWADSKDEKLQVLNRVLQNETTSKQFFSNSILSWWIKHGWNYPKDFFQSIILFDLKNQNQMKSFRNELKKMCELETFSLESTFCLELLEKSGVPDPVSTGLHLDFYITKKDSSYKNEKKSTIVTGMESVLDILYIVIKRVAFTHDTLEQFLFSLFLVSLETEKYTFKMTLFNVISTCINANKSFNWKKVGLQWRNMIFDFCQQEIRNVVVIRFFQDCNLMYDNPVLQEWSRSCCHIITINWSKTGDELKRIPQSEINLQALFTFLHQSILLTKQTPCYDTTNTLLMLIRLQITPDILQGCKKSGKEIALLLKTFHGKIDDRMGIHLDRSRVKDELLRLHTIISLLLQRDLI